jgi:hypothetical protein
MTTVMLKADEELLAKAEKAIAGQNVTLDDLFERTLREAAAGAERLQRHDEMMDSLRHIDLGGPYTRDEMNER